MTPDVPKDNGKAARDKLEEMMYGWRKVAMRAAGVSVTGRHNAHPERDIQNACLQWLTLRKVCHVRLSVNSSTIMAGGKMIRLPNPMRGWPDILTIVKGRAVGLEIKASTKQSEEQKSVQEYIEKAGGLYYVIHSISELESALKPLL